MGYLLPGVFLVFGVFVTYNSTDLFHDFGKFVKTNSTSVSFEISVVLVAVVYIIGHFFSFLSGFTVEKFSVWFFGAPEAYLFEKQPVQYFKEVHRKPADLLIRIGIFLAILPMSLFSLIALRTGKLDLVERSIPETYQIALRKRFSELFPEIDFHTSDYFGLVYHYSFESFEGHAAKFQNYVALYGFTRCMSLVFTILLWYSICALFAGLLGIDLALIFIPGAMLHSIVFFLAYNKFYRRFHLEVVMAFISVAKPESTEA